MDQGTITTILATWGAVVSSFAVGWQFYRDITQRGRLRVSCYIGKLVGGPGGIDPNDYLVYNVTNVGKEPVMLTHIGGEMKQHHFIVNTDRLPLMLQPGEYILEYKDELSVLGADLKRLTAIDSVGRVWKAPRRQVKKLKADYASGKYGKKKTGS